MSISVGLSLRFLNGISSRNVYWQLPSYNLIADQQMRSYVITFSFHSLIYLFVLQFCGINLFFLHLYGKVRQTVSFHFRTTEFSMRNIYTKAANIGVNLDFNNIFSEQKSVTKISVQLRRQLFLTRFPILP